MSTRFDGEGNIGSDPQVKVFPSNDNSPPRAILRLNVFFDNPVASGDGKFEDRGGFWTTVEISRDVESCEHWSRLYQRGMRVLVSGRMVREEWKTDAGEDRNAMKVRARAIGILPFRIDQMVMAQPQGGNLRQRQVVESIPAEARTDVVAFEEDIPPDLEG